LQIFYIEPDDLRYACTGVVHGREHDGIAMTAPGAAIRSMKNGGDFFLREIRNRHAVKAFDGDGKAMAD
jgi:hypothetical protein